jgi:hypothetical protein
VYAGPQDESSNINIQKPSNPIIYTPAHGGKPQDKTQEVKHPHGVYNRVKKRW